MISDLSFLCSTITFADPPTPQNHCKEQGTGQKGYVRLHVFFNYITYLADVQMYKGSMAIICTVNKHSI